MSTPVGVRQIARREISLLAEYYESQAGIDVRERFLGSLSDGLDQLSRYPRLGSLRWSYEARIDDLRAWPLEGFPVTIFYFALPDLVDVRRVLHSKRDVVAALTSSG